MAGKPYYNTEMLREKGKEIYGDRYDFSQSIFIPGKNLTRRKLLSVPIKRSLNG